MQRLKQLTKTPESGLPNSSRGFNINVSSVINKKMKIAKNHPGGVTIMNYPREVTCGELPRRGNI